MALPEIYVSTDVEADGPIPGPHSMLSFASAAFTAEKQLVSSFSANLTTLPGASAHDGDTPASHQASTISLNRSNRIAPFPITFS